MPDRVVNDDHNRGASTLDQSSGRLKNFLNPVV